MPVRDPASQLRIEPQLGQLIERARDWMHEPMKAHAGPLQLTQVRAGAEPLPQVVRQRAQVRALRAAHEDGRIRGPEPQQPGLVDVHLPRLARNLLARARELVEPLPLYLAGGVHRRGLLDEPDEAL